MASNSKTYTNARKKATEVRWHESTKRFINMVQREMQSKGTYIQSDNVSLQLLGQLYNDWLEVQTVIDEQGLLIPPPRPNAKPSPHPLLTTKLKLFQSILSMLKEIGLTLKSRKNLTVLNETDTTADLMEKFNAKFNVDDEDEDEEL